jgi:ABC-type Fe3+-hydroxamate transport system substrate-binding protein
MNYRKIHFAVLFLVLMFSAALPLAAGGSQEKAVQAVSETRYYQDSYNRSVEIPTKLNRIISLGPNMTEIIFSLDRLL